MALEKYASTNPNTIHTDVLSEARQACYKARDAFYACLEKESNKKPTEIASVGLLYPAECKESRAQYVSQCRPTWVKHFDRQYCSKKRVQRLLDDNESRRDFNQLVTGTAAHIVGGTVLLFVLNFTQLPLSATTTSNERALVEGLMVLERH